MDNARLYSDGMTPSSFDVFPLVFIHSGDIQFKRSHMRSAVTGEMKAIHFCGCCCSFPGSSQNPHRIGLFCYHDVASFFASIPLAAGQHWSLINSRSALITDKQLFKLATGQQLFNIDPWSTAFQHWSLINTDHRSTAVQHWSMINSFSRQTTDQQLLTLIPDQQHRSTPVQHWSLIFFFF